MSQFLNPKLLAVRNLATALEAHVGESCLVKSDRKFFGRGPKHGDPIFAALPAEDSKNVSVYTLLYNPGVYLGDPYLRNFHM